MERFINIAIRETLKQKEEEHQKLGLIMKIQLAFLPRFVAKLIHYHVNFNVIITTRQIIFLSINYMNKTQFNPLRWNYHSSLVVKQLSSKICSWRPITNLVQCIIRSTMKKLHSVDLSPNETLSRCNPPHTRLCSIWYR